METIDSHLWNHQLAERLTHHSPIRHFLGGPVGLPNQIGPASQTVVLHHIPNIQGATAVLEWPAAAGQGRTAQQQQQQQVVWGGTRAIEPRQRDHWRRQQQQRRWCPGWLGFCFSAHADGQQQQQQQVLQHHALTSGSSASQRSSNTRSHSSSSSSDDHSKLGLYQGGSLDDVLRVVLRYNTNAAAAATAATAAPHKGSSLASKLRSWNRPAAAAAAAKSATSQPQQQQQQQGPSGSNRRQQQQQVPDDLSNLRAAVRMYHGVCSWSVGQLEGEIRAGAWGVITQADMLDFVETPPQHLWQQLTHGNRPRWF